ncbi:pyruvate formate lyase family protein [Ignavibacteria bacterium 4148-Me]|uniref:pyruvate formate lyase family protein n=1 Tax=Rosettibacter primus TaxID=3111523 RepID=UPI00336BD902
MKNSKYNTELKFTETYKKYYNEHPAIREAMCLKAEYPDYFLEIQDNDLFAGRIKHGKVGFSPDEWGPTAFGYYCQFEEIEKDLTENNFTQEDKEKIIEMMNFWKNEDTSEKLRRAYPPIMAKYLFSDDWMNTSGIAFPLYRLTGGTPNFKKLLSLGIPGLYQEIERYKNIAEENNGDIKFYEGMKLALNVLVDVCMYYKNQAEEKAKIEINEERKNELHEMANVLYSITIVKPRTFREAIQLFWLYTLVADVRNYGRMDVYLGDFYVNDLNAGALSEEKALKLLQSLWLLMADRHTIVHNRVIIGGKGRPNEENADKFSLLALEATRTIKEIEPQLSLRIYHGMNPKVYEKALDVIGEGRTFPILYNDDVNIPAIMRAFNFTEKEAEQYVPYGCGEYILEHQSFGTPSGVINLLKALEVTLHNGVDPLTKKVIGLQLGEFNDFKTFDDLWNAYKKQVEFFVDLLAEQEVLEYKIAGEQAPFLLLSMLYDDCLERGKGIFSGGIRYLGGTIETYGNTNTADSLLAIKKMVYEDKEITQDELLTALDSNFVGYEALRKKLIALPKYGNDNEEADSMLLKVHNHVCNYVRNKAKEVGLHSYLVVIINNSANTLMGKSTSASADGRLAYEHMNNGNAPSGGYDREGVTAMLNSIVKPDPSIHAGAVQNMKFSPELFFEKREVIKSLLNTYFQKGGTQAMITVVNRGDLEKALVEPEKYRHIFVRVGGFTARFVELSKEVQKDILSRTLY